MSYAVPKRSPGSSSLSTRPHLRRLGGLLACALLFLPPEASPAAEQRLSPQALRSAVLTFLRNELAEQPGTSDAIRTSIEVGAIDARLRLHRCQQPLVFKLHNNRRVGRTTVKVECQDGKPWSIFVPATIRVHRPVVVAATPIARGARVTAAQLTLAEREISTLHYGYYTQIDNVAGQIARRHLNGGDALYPAALQPPQLIHQGDTVVITARSDTLTVRMSGTALEDGAKGKQIRVRNNRSERIIKAVVVGKGQVEVPL